MFKNLNFVFMMAIAGSAMAQVGVVNADTSQAAPLGRYIISGKADTLYVRGDSGPKTLIFPLDTKVVDTLANRPVLLLPDYVDDLIPDSSHIVIEADYLKARTSGNSYFDTLRVGWDYYNLLKDSIELVLPDFDTLLSDHQFHVTFFGWDSDSSFYHNHDSSFYKAVVNNSGVKVDSVLTHTVNSILYFSDTIYYESKSTGQIYASNYMASNHPRLPFRIPNENNALISFNLFYNANNDKYYIR